MNKENIYKFDRKKYNQFEDFGKITSTKTKARHKKICKYVCLFCINIKGQKLLLNRINELLINY